MTYADEVEQCYEELERQIHEEELDLILALGE